MHAQRSASGFRSNRWISAARDTRHRSRGCRVLALRRNCIIGGMLRVAFMVTAFLAAGLGVVAQTGRADADLNQLMRGVLYPAANVVFFAQADNPAEVK